MTYCVNTVLEVKNKTKESCVSTVSHKQELVISKSFSVFCPCLSNQSDAKRSEMTWYKVRNLFPMNFYKTPTDCYIKQVLYMHIIYII